MSEESKPRIAKEWGRGDVKYRAVVAVHGGGGHKITVESHDGYNRNALGEPQWGLVCTARLPQDRSDSTRISAVNHRFAGEALVELLHELGDLFRP